MQEPCVSLIWDVFELQDEIAPVLRAISAEARGLGCGIEVVIVDRGSQDGTVFEALQAAKEQPIPVKVVQSGAGADGTALNTGLFRSSGKYVSFVRSAGSFFRGHLKPLYDAAVKKDADLAFGEMISPDYGAGRPSITQRIRHVYFREGNGADFLLSMIRREKAADFGCLLVRRDFIFQNKILFNETCRCGYEEEFLDRCLLLTDNVCEVRGPFVRDRSFSLLAPVEGPEFSCFDRVDALVRIAEDAKAYRQNNKRLATVLLDDMIPRSILDCVELLLQKGRGYNAVNHYINRNGYRKLLRAGRGTPLALQRKILLWRNLPWMYSA